MFGRLLFTIILFLHPATLLPAMEKPSCEHVKLVDLDSLTASGTEVRTSGQIIADADFCFVLSDKDTSKFIMKSREFTANTVVGDFIDALVRIRKVGPNQSMTAVYILNAKVKGHAPIHDTPAKISINEAYNPSNHYKTVCLEGTITDAFIDELDPGFEFLTLEYNDKAILLEYRNQVGTETAHKSFIGQCVMVTGILTGRTYEYRKYSGPRLKVDMNRSFIPIETSKVDLDARFPRQTNITGIMLVSCDNKSFYLRTRDDERIKVFLLDEQKHPPIGQEVSVSGFMRHNIFFASLANARILHTSPKHGDTETPAEISPRELLFDAKGYTKIKASSEGRLYRIIGTVSNISGAGTENTVMTLDCDGIGISVRLGTIQPPRIGSLVQATGICSLKAETDGNKLGIIRLTGLSFLTRDSNDIVVLRDPPWWTPGKFIAVIISLVAVIAAILLWNKSLKSLAERRGRELMTEQLGRVAADLKVNERTRLAVELHDALSQNLTGVSLQLDAVKRFADEDRGRMARHLDMAMRTLKSCRDELRNCLWDLRNRALEEADMNEAIRRTASPFVGDATLFIRFNVPRDQISDNTAHALMRIIRELATNAVRHGAAKTIRIAGALENGRLLFSVSDDGSGFDPADHPGVNEGHFGLDGIRERIENLGGSMEIESAADGGTTIRISMTA